MQVQSLSQERPLEKGSAIHFSILAWRIPGTGEPCGLQSIESQRVRHAWSILAQLIAHTHVTLPHNALTSHASKVMLKILQARLQQDVNWELSDVQAGFRKGRGNRDQIANIHWIIVKSKGIPEKKKKSTAASLSTLKPLTL